MSALSAGTRLGPYEVVAPIGAGGMGEVFKARDTRLERSVAIKVLPSEFAQNAQLRLRFEREAKSISQLNHPHICTLYDVGNENGVEYLVLEYIEGETLSDRLARGPLPLQDVLRLGTQVAQALARAHGAGIVHRDLKPGNVMITPAGAKLLDFGLARSAASSSTVAPATDLTVQKPLTQEGTILGTFQYMAPEQLAGEEADERTDIFALGAVLYEMLTGVRAFQGKSKTSLIAAIAGSEPQPPSRLQPLTPPALEHVIAKCLAKEPSARWQSAADVASELEWITASPQQVAEGVAARSPRWPLWTAIVVLIGLLAAAAGIAVHFQRRAARAEEPLRAELMLPPGEQLGIVAWGAMALSPDGSKLALNIGRFGSNVIAIRDLATGELTKLAGTERSQYPFWSPDGKQIGFFAQGKLQVIPASGGPVQVLCDAPQGRGGSWSPRGVIIFTPDILAPVYAISEAGGVPRRLTTPGAGQTNRNAVFLPDGSTFLYCVNNSTTEGVPGGLYAGSIDHKLQKLITTDASNAAYSGGRLFFIRNHNLVAQQFDPGSLTLSGPPIAVADHIAYTIARDLGDFSVAGNKIVWRSAQAVPVQLATFDRDGKQLATNGGPGDLALLDVSPDGRRAAVRMAGVWTGNDLWMMDLDRGVLTRVTSLNLPYEIDAAFSPDGKRIAVAHGDAFSRFSVTLQSLDGGAPEPVIQIQKLIRVRQWSRDGRYLLASTQNLGTLHDIGYIDIQRRTFTLVVHGPAEEQQPALSPDGKWLAYASSETGGPQVYLTRFPSGEGKWQVTADGGYDPRWSADGKRLYFISKTLWSVPIGDGAAPQIGTPVPLPIEPAPLGGALGVGYAETPDGRFVILKRVGEVPPNPIHLITNWAKLLPR